MVTCRLLELVYLNTNVSPLEQTEDVKMGSSSFSLLSATGSLARQELLRQVDPENRDDVSPSDLLVAVLHIMPQAMTQEASESATTHPADPH